MGDNEGGGGGTSRNGVELGERTRVVVVVVVVNLREGTMKSFAGFGKDDEDLEVDGVRRDNRHDELDELGRWSFFFNVIF